MTGTCHCLNAALVLTSAATRSVNLELQPTKIQVRRASCLDPISQELPTLSPVLLCLQWRKPRVVCVCVYVCPASTLAQPNAELNAEGLSAQTVTDLLTMCIGVASQHVLRMSVVLEHEARTFDTEVIAFWSQLIKRDATCPLFHLLTWCWLSCAAQRAAPCVLGNRSSQQSWHTLFTPTPRLRAQLAQLQTTLSQQMDNLASWSSPARHLHLTNVSPPSNQPSHPHLSVCTPHWCPPVTAQLRSL